MAVLNIAKFIQITSKSGFTACFTRIRLSIAALGVMTLTIITALPVGGIHARRRVGTQIARPFAYFVAFNNPVPADLACHAGITAIGI